MGDSHKTPFTDEDLLVIGVLRERDSTFSGDKPPDRLSNSKWSALNTYTYEQHQMDPAGYVSMCVYVLISVCVYVFDVYSKNQGKVHKFKKTLEEVDEGVREIGIM